MGALNALDVAVDRVDDHRGRFPARDCGVIRQRRPRRRAERHGWRAGTTATGRELSRTRSADTRERECRCGASVVQSLRQTLKTIDALSLAAPEARR